MSQPPRTPSGPPPPPPSQPLLLQQALTFSSQEPPESPDTHNREDPNRNKIEYIRCSQEDIIVKTENSHRDTPGSGMDLRNGIQEFHTLRYQTNNNELNNNSRNGDMNDFRSGNNIHHGTNNNLSINPNLKNATSHIFTVNNDRNAINNDRNNLHLQRSNVNMNNVNEIILTSNNVNDLTTQRNNGDYRNSISDEYSRLNNSGIQDKNLENSLRNNVLNNIERQNSYQNHFAISDNISRKLGSSPNVPMDTVKNAMANNIANHIDVHRVNNNVDMHRTNNKIEIRTSNEMRILKPAPVQAQQISLSSVQTVDSVSYGQPTLYVIPQNSQHDKKFVIIKSEPLDTVQVIKNF